MQKMKHYRSPTYANQTYMSIPPGNLGAKQVKFSARVLKGDKQIEISILIFLGTEYIRSQN